MSRSSLYIFVFYALVVLLLLFLPLDGLGSFMRIKLFGWIRLGYLLHVAAFIPLIPLWKQNWPRHAMWMILLAGLVIAALLEGIHYVLPYRNFDVYDLWANMTGVAIGFGVTGLFGPGPGGIRAAGA